MKRKKFWLGMLVLVLVFGFIFTGCDELLEEETGPEVVNGVWYGVDQFSDWRKIGSVITVSNGEGILTSVGDDFYGDKVIKGLINIGDPVFKNVNYLGSKEDNSIYIYSYDVWAERNSSTTNPPEWINDCKLYVHTKFGKDGKTAVLQLSGIHENVLIFQGIK